MSGCTGLTARWCPVHGDCKCAEPVFGPLDDPICPLHSPMSPHPIVKRRSIVVRARREAQTPQQGEI